MLSINETTICGNLTRDVELKALPNGTSVANFSIATNRTWKDSDGKKQEQVEYHNCVFFGKRADVIAQYFTKGKSIYVRGRLQTRSWEKDGVKMYRTEVVGEDFKFAGSKADSATPAPTPPPATTPAPTQDAPDYPEDEINPEDIPFN